MNDPDCLFCRIVSGDLQAEIVHETARTLAFRDRAPQAPTHVLVVPRDHYPDMPALAGSDPAYAGELLAAAAQVARLEGLDGGHRMIANTGVDGGQTVFHVHVHVLGGRPLGVLAG